MFCENIPQDWCNFPVEVTEENKRTAVRDRNKNDVHVEAYRGCGLSVCRNKREFKPGPHVAGMDPHRRMLWNRDLGNPGNEKSR